VVEVHRVVPDPRHPLAALANLVDRPEDLEELLALRALTDPLAVDALHEISLVPPRDRYIGPRASVVMTPFLLVGPSRFSPGTYGVLYTADAFIVAVRESSYHAGRYLRAAHITEPAIVPRYGLQLDLDPSNHADIRQGGADDVHEPAIYDPLVYDAAQSFGSRLRANGRPGVWYDSVRSAGGTCYATFKPVAVKDVAESVREIELLWDGAAITEYREVTTYQL
jgi:hypothetical protein